MKKNLANLLLVLLLAFSFLFSGDPNKDQPFPTCSLNYVQINRLMGFPVNCDAFAFMGGAARPSYLLQNGYIRQSRPGYIILGSLTGYSLYCLSWPLHGAIESYLEKKFSSNPLLPPAGERSLYACIYAGFVIINLVLCLLCLWLFGQIIAIASGPWRNGQLLFYAFCLALLSNQITQHFIWTVHPQLFNLFTPLFIIYSGLVIINHPSNNKVLRFSVLSGLLLLVYGNFLLTLPVLITAYLIRIRRNKNEKRRHTWIILSASLILFCLPTLLWTLTLWIAGVRFFSHEVAMNREFIWIIDSLNKGFAGFLAAMGDKAVTYMKTFSGVVPALLLLIIAQLVASPGSDNEKAERSNQRMLMAFIAATAVIFYWALGYYADRLTTAIAPVAICFAAILINRQRLRPAIQYLFVALIAVWHFYIIIFGIPHFANTFFQ